MGRPTTYTKEIADELCSRLSAGESVRQICRCASMPAESTIYLWLLKSEHKEFSENYAKAREMQAEVLFDEMLEIADDASNDWIEREQKDGRIDTVYDNEHVNRSRLRIDTRKFYLSKVLPKKFGDNPLVAVDASVHHHHTVINQLHDSAHKGISIDLTGNTIHLNATPKGSNGNGNGRNAFQEGPRIA